MPVVLVIDDNPSIATALDVLLSLHEIETLHAASPAHSSKCLPASANCAAVLAAPMRSRRAICAESRKHCSQYQPRCLRAIRTPVSSP